MCGPTCSPPFFFWFSIMFLRFISKSTVLVDFILTVIWACNTLIFTWWTFSLFPVFFFFSFFFLHRHNIYLVKRKDCNLVHAGMAATRTLWLVCQNGGLLIEGKRKLRKGVVRTIELYCKHRVPVGFSCTGFSRLHRARELP